MTTEPDVKVRVTTAPPPRRTFWQWAATWSPDPRWHTPLVAGEVVYAAGWVPVVWPSVPPWALAAVVPVVVWAGRHAMRTRWPAERFGHQLGEHGGHLVTWAAVGAAAWLVWLAAGHHTPLSGAGLLLAGLAAAALVYGVLETRAPTLATRLAEVQKEAVVALRTTDRRAMWEHILTAEGFGGLEVVSDADTASGYTLGVANRETMPDGCRPVSFSALAKGVPSLSVRAGMEFDRRGDEFREGWLAVERAAGASHVFLIHVTTKDVQAGKLDYPADTPPTPVAECMNLGRYNTGEPVRIDLAHTVVVGATGSGKSVMGNVLIAEMTRQPYIEPWIGTTAKLVPLVYPWLKPWFAGETTRPVLGWAAGQDIKEVLRMGRAAIREMRHRNASLDEFSSFTPTREQPAIIFMVDEAGTAAKHRDTIDVDGVDMTLSDIGWLIGREGRSAQVWMLYLAGSALFGTFGVRGPEIQRDVTQRLCGRTLTYSDGASTLNMAGRDADTTALRDNTFLLQPSTDEARILPLKSWYVEANQDVNLVHPIAVRHSGRRADLEAERAARLGADWSERWSRDRCPELVRACERNGMRWPTDTEIRDDRDREPAGGEDSRSAIAPEAVRDLTENGGPGGARDGMLTDRERETLAAIEAAEFARTEGETVRDYTGGIPTPDETIARLRDLARATYSRPRLPRLLADIENALDADGAPPAGGFVTTAALAVTLGRVDGDADEVEVRRATETLGRELRALVPALASRLEGRQAGRARRRGYDVDRLRAAIGAVRDGRELEAGPESDVG